MIYIFIIKINYIRHITEIYGGWRLGDINHFSAKNKKDLNSNTDYYKVIYKVKI
jgi:hypothetical protein